MMISIKKINYKMYNLSKLKFIFTILALDFIISAMLIPIIIFFPNSIGSMRDPDIQNLKILFIAGTIIAPLWETLAYQWGVIKLFSLNKKIKNNKLFLIFISAFFFGAIHYYSILNIIRGFIAGLLLAYSFIVYEDKEKSGYWVTAIIHSLMNLVTFVLKTL